MISEQALADFAAQVEQLPPVERDERLVGSFAESRVTLCSENDISGLARPVYQGQGFDLYLVDASNACAGLTNDFARACGVVLALHDDEDND